MKKIVLNLIAAIAGIAIGAAASGYLVFLRYAKQDAVVRVFASSSISNAVSQQEFDKKSDDAKKDLLSTLAIYQGAGQTPGIELGVQKALRMNCGLMEARLSILEDEGANSARSKAYMLKAQSDLKSVGWTDISEETILDVVKRKPASQ